jgi:ribonuclease P protein component
MTYFFAERIAGPALAPASGPRVGLTAGRVLGKAVERNRIKLILHPRRTVLTAEFDRLQGEVSRIFAVIQKNEKKSDVSRG